MSAIIAAHPGWFVIFGYQRMECVKGGEVIAWEINDDGFVEPITSSGREDDCIGFIRPDGCVETGGGDYYDNFDEYVKAVKEVWAPQKATF